MDDLNDLFYFAKVVECGGFAAAGRALRQPKSKLSRRVSQLESNLGMRLIERSTRRFRVTDIGSTFYERCRAILDDVDQAQALVAEARSEPQGIVRCSCPTGLVETVMPFLPELLTRHPRMRLQLIAIDRPVELIAERIDVAIRVRVSMNSDAELTMRALQKNRRILVAAAAWARHIADATDVGMLSGVPTLSSSVDSTEVTWDLIGPAGEKRTIRHQPRFASSDFLAVRSAAIADLGVAFLPQHSCLAALETGQLVQVFPAWSGLPGTMHVVFTTRRGLPPAARALIDHLVARMSERSAP